MASSIKITVRMYRQGLGDCFLLQFQNGNSKKFILIDCGVLQNTTGDKEIMNNVAQSIKETCNGVLDLVIITHEHWDHISGFHHAKSVFNEFTFKEVWMGWIEDPKDTDAKKIKDEINSRSQSLKLGLELLSQLESTHGIDAALFEDAKSLMAFHGLAAGERVSTTDIMDYIRSKAPGQEPKYLRPGSVEKLTGLPGIKFYVLGPPTTAAAIKRESSSKKGKLYGEERSLTSFDRFMESLEFLPQMINEDQTDSNAQQTKGYPFHQKYQISQDQANKSYSSYFEKKQDWRSIKFDWVSEFNDFAVKLVTGTNNTSLVLAIEIEGSGEILLFPGDAQLGNWESWEAVSFSGEQSTVVKAQDLLKKTILYKVGHHGSHNATMQDGGLESMTSEKLIALIPNSKEIAKKQGRKDEQTGQPKGWAMPFIPLLKRLSTKTAGKVVESDTGKLTKTDDRISEVVDQINWKGFTASEVKTDNLYIDIKLK